MSLTNLHLSNVDPTRGQLSYFVCTLLNQKNSFENYFKFIMKTLAHFQY